MKREAAFYEILDTGDIQCVLCPIMCRIKPGQTGVCSSRQNIEGRMVLLNYGQVSALHVDPMEKKPLYHFLPGSSILSLGNNGCNLRCAFCQNWQISQITSSTRFIGPAEVVRQATDLSLPAVAFTYAEPSVWFEYVLDTSRLLHDAGIKVVLVTNGLINEEPFRSLEPWIDALNIDIKSMDPRFYTGLCKGPLEPVLKTCIRAVETCHVEITNLIIPGENDSDRNFHDLARFIRDHLGRNTVLHLSRYHPAYQFQKPPTPLSTLARACQIAREYLDFVFPGNISSPKEESTLCPECGSRLIDRYAYVVNSTHLDASGNCPDCGYRTGIVLQ